MMNDSKIIAFIDSISTDNILKFGSVGIVSIESVPNGIKFNLANGMSYTYDLTTNTTLMYKSMYDSNSNGKVDISEKSELLLNTTDGTYKGSSFFLDKSNHIGNDLATKVTIDKTNLLKDLKTFTGATLQDLVDYLDKNYLNYINTALDTKVDKVTGKSLIDETKITKLDGISPNAKKTEKSNINGNVKIDEVETVVYTHPTSISPTNPHNTTKSDVGLDKVENIAPLDLPISTATQTALNNKVDKITGKQLSTEDYTTVEKTKLSKISEGANKVLDSATNGNILIDGVETVIYEHPTGLTPTNPHGTTKADVGLDKVINEEQIPLTQKGVPIGVATLDDKGKVPMTQIPDSLIGREEYLGTWDATLNIPIIKSGEGTKGGYYICNVAGTTEIDGNKEWKIGDNIKFNGVKWDRIPAIAGDHETLNNLQGGKDNSDGKSSEHYHLTRAEYGRAKDTIVKILNVTNETIPIDVFNEVEGVKFIQMTHDCAVTLPTEKLSMGRKFTVINESNQYNIKIIYKTGELTVKPLGVKTVIAISDSTFAEFTASGSGGESDHEKLTNLQGGDNTLHEHYHIDKKEHDMVQKQKLGIVEAEKVIVSDRDKKFDFIKVEKRENKTYFGSTDFSNVLVSTNKEDLYHEYNLEPLNEQTFNEGRNKIPKGKYTFTCVAPTFEKNGGLRNITKITLESLGDTVNNTPTKARVAIYKDTVVDANNIYENCPSGYYVDLIDNLSLGYTGQIIVNDKKLNYVDGATYKIVVDLETDNGLLGTTLPKCSVVFQNIAKGRITDIQTLYELNPNANTEVSDDNCKYEIVGDTSVCISSNNSSSIRPSKLVISPFYKDYRVTKWTSIIPYNNTGNIQLKEVELSNVEIADSKTGEAHISTKDNLLEINAEHLKEVVGTLVADCKILEKIYVPNLETISDKFIEKCPKATIYCKPNGAVQQWCINKGIAFVPVGLPTVKGVGKGKVLTTGDNETYAWQDGSGGTNIDDWDKTKSYKVEEIVIFEKSFYRCILATIPTDVTPKSDATHWENIGGSQSFWNPSLTISYENPTFAIGNDEKNKNVFYVSGENKSWCSEDITTYNCPKSGYEIPSKDDYDNIIKNKLYTWVDYDKDYKCAGLWINGLHATTHVGSVFLPANCAMIDSNEGALTQDNYSAYYWTKTSFDRNKAYCFIVQPTPRLMEFEKSYGFVIRAIKKEGTDIVWDTTNIGNNDCFQYGRLYSQETSMRPTEGLFIDPLSIKETNDKQFVTLDEKNSIKANTLHEKLPDLLGGGVNEHYHLTKAELDKLNNGGGKANVIDLIEGVSNPSITSCGRDLIKYNPKTDAVEVGDKYSPIVLNGNGNLKYNAVYDYKILTFGTKDTILNGTEYSTKLKIENSSSIKGSFRFMNLSMANENPFKVTLSLKTLYDSKVFDRKVSIIKRNGEFIAQLDLKFEDGSYISLNGSDTIDVNIKVTEGSPSFKGSATLPYMEFVTNNEEERLFLDSRQMEQSVVVKTPLDAFVISSMGYNIITKFLPEKDLFKTYENTMTLPNYEYDTRIEANVFKFSSGRPPKKIYIPPCYTEIKEGNFDRSYFSPTVYGQYGTYAETWAKSKGYPFFSDGSFPKGGNVGDVLTLGTDNAVSWKPASVISKIATIEDAILGLDNEKSMTPLRMLDYIQGDFEFQKISDVTDTFSKIDNKINVQHMIVRNDRQSESVVLKVIQNKTVELEKTINATEVIEFDLGSWMARTIEITASNFTKTIKNFMPKPNYTISMIVGNTIEETGVEWANTTTPYNYKINKDRVVFPMATIQDCKDGIAENILINPKVLKEYTSNFEIKTPYLKLTSVTPIKTTSKKGDRVDIVIEETNADLIKKSTITINVEGQWETISLSKDVDKYYFDFPWNLDATYENKVIECVVGWKDSKALLYEGFETLKVSIIKG